jgi:hypothetical protein
MAQLESASEGNPIGGTEEALALAAARSRPREKAISERSSPERAPQISLFELSPANPALEELRERLAELDINALTPVQALIELERLQRTARLSNESP